MMPWKIYLLAVHVSIVFSLYVFLQQLYCISFIDWEYLDFIVCGSKHFAEYQCQIKLRSDLSCYDWYKNE